MAEMEFVDGMRVSRPERAPEFIVAKLGLKREALIKWLETHDEEWINVELRRSKAGKYYAAVEAPRERRPDPDPSNGDSW